MVDEQIIILDHLSYDEEMASIDDTLFELELSEVEIMEDCIMEGLSKTLC